MWGLAKADKSQNETDKNEPQRITVDQITPKWQQRQPLLTYVFFIIQCFLFAGFLYLIFIPNIQYWQIQAARKSLEETYYETRGLSCVESTKLCSSGFDLSEFSYRKGVWRDISTLDEVFLWIYNVLAVYWQGGFIGNYNRAMTLKLSVVPNDIDQEKDDYYLTLIAKRPNFRSRITTIATYQRTFFRSLSDNADLRKELIALRDKEAWFRPETTKKVLVVLKLLNVFAMPWIVLEYNFDQTFTGTITKTINVKTMKVLQTHNSDSLLELICVYFITFTIMIDIVLEVSNIKSWIVQHHVNALLFTNRFQALKSALQMYFKKRWGVCTIKLLKFCLALMVLCQLFSVFVVGPPNALIAQINQNANVPERFLLFRSVSLLYITGFLCLIFLTFQPFLHLRRIHEDFGILTDTLYWSWFTSIHLTIMFICGLSGFGLAYVFLFGSQLICFSTIQNGLISVFLCLFGLSLNSCTTEAPVKVYTMSSIVLTYMLHFCYHFIFIPCCTAMIDLCYAFKRSQQLLHYETTCVSRLVSMWKKTYKRHCFWMTPNPIQLVKNFDPSLDGKRPSCLLQSHVSKSLILTQISATSMKQEGLQLPNLYRHWEYISVMAYVLFFLTFLYSGIILLNIEKQRQYHLIMQNHLLKKVFPNRFVIQPIPPSGEKDQITLPNANISETLSIIWPSTGTQIFSLTSFPNWFVETVVLRVMDPEFHKLRHTVPLCNPLLVFFLMSDTRQNNDPFTKPLWSQQTYYGVIANDLLINHQTNDYPEGSFWDDQKETVSFHRSDPSLFYYASLFYGNVDAIAQDFEALFPTVSLLTGALRFIQMKWIEYNSNARVFILYDFNLHVDISGALTSTLTTLTFHESSTTNKKTEDVTSKPDMFPFFPFSIFALAFFFFLMYIVCLVGAYRENCRVLTKWEIVLTHEALFIFFSLRVSLPSFFITLHLLLVYLNNFFSFSRNSFPKYQTSSIINLQRFNLLSRSQQQTTESFFMLFPSKKRTAELLSMFMVLSQKRLYLKAAFIGGAMISHWRLLLFVFSFLDVFSAKINSLYHHVRGKIIVIFNFFFWINTLCTLVCFLMWGNRSNAYSNLQKSWISSWYLSTPNWNLEFFPFQDLPTSCKLFLIAFVSLWTFFFHPLVISVIYDGLYRLGREKNIQIQLSLEKKEHENVVPIETVSFRCNLKTIICLKAVHKLLLQRFPLPVTSERNDEIKEASSFNIHNIFITILDAAALEPAPKNFKEHVMKEIGLQKLTQIQHYLCFILLFQCKASLIAIDQSQLKEEYKSLTQNCKEKEKYADKLIHKLEDLKKKVEKIQNKISFQQADFLPDVVEYSARPIERAHYHISENELKSQQEHLNKSKKTHQRNCQRRNQPTL